MNNKLNQGNITFRTINNNTDFGVNEDVHFPDLVNNNKLKISNLNNKKKLCFDLESNNYYSSLSEVEDYDIDSVEGYWWDILNSDCLKSKEKNKSKKITNSKNNDHVLVEEGDRYVLNTGDGIMMNNSIDKPI